MQALRVETQVRQDGSILLNGLPWLAGESVEVIVLPQGRPKVKNPDRPLEGLPLHYERPFDPVAEEDWEVLR